MEANPTDAQPSPQAVQPSPPKELTDQTIEDAMDHTASNTNSGSIKKEQEEEKQGESGGDSSDQIAEKKLVNKPIDADSDAVTELDQELIAIQMQELAVEGDFSTLDLLSRMDKINKAWATDTVIIGDYSRALSMWVVSLKHLGSAISVAFKDTKDKAKDMIENQSLWINDLKVLAATAPQANYLLPFCMFEAEKNVAHFNGDNNKKKLKTYNKEDIQPFMTKYISTSRHIWRNQWLFAFLGQVLQRIAKEQDSKLSTIAKEEYKVHLKPHHPYWLQKVANAAMLAVNYRKTFIKSFMEEQQRAQKKELTEEEAYELVYQMGRSAQLLSDNILMTVRKHDLDKLE